jgi:hypothetical protein
VKVVEIKSERIRQLAPFGLPLLILIVGWMFLVRPAAAERARASRQADTLGQRLVAARASVAQPPPAVDIGDPAAAFQRQVAAGDATSPLMEQLARLASSASVTNLLMETSERVVMTAAQASGPQVAGASPDPRFMMFDTPLTYSPVSMSFDGEYARVGDLLWRLRSLATAVEIRELEIRPRLRGGAGPSGEGASEARSVQDGVHVSLTLFAYARQTPPSPLRGFGEAGTIRPTTSEGTRR